MSHSWLKNARAAGKRTAKEAFELSGDPQPYAPPRAISSWMREVVPGSLHGAEEGAIKSAFFDGYREEYVRRKKHHRHSSGGGSVVTFADVKNLGRLP